MIFKVKDRVVRCGNIGGMARCGMSILKIELANETYMRVKAAHDGNRLNLGC